LSPALNSIKHFSRTYQ